MKARTGRPRGAGQEDQGGRHDQGRLAKANGELKKLKLMSPMSAEATVVRNYIETLIGLPWRKKTRISKDLPEAQKVLDKDHYGLERVKERILEYLAVQQRVDKLKAPIPVPRRTSGRRQDLARPVDRQATNRKFVRMALGGARRGRDPRSPSYLHRFHAGQDPAEHVQGRGRNPLFLLDRSRQDGPGFSWRSVVGIAGSARSRAEPHLSGTTTSGRLRSFRRDVRRHRQHDEHPGAAARPDGMIRLSGYTEDEKVNIAERYLLPKQMKSQRRQENRIDRDDSALRDIVRYYTRSRRACAGTRGVEDLPQGRSRRCC